jgi:polysaccharide biosynthesis/export protein
MKRVLIGLLLLNGPAYSQSVRPVIVTDEIGRNYPSLAPTSMPGVEYRIGQDDLVEVSVFEVPELGGSGRVSAAGLIPLPLVGEIHAAGKTPQEMARLIETALKSSGYVNDPHVTVFVREYASQPVSIIGAVKMPGIYQLKGHKSLLEMLAMAQGLDMTAGKTITVIRGKGSNPLTTEPADDATQTKILNIEELFAGTSPELNIQILPGDVINVPQAGSVFVVGEVSRPGEFILRQGKDVTVTQAAALGGGFSRDAKLKECLIIRAQADGTKIEIPVNMQKVLQRSLQDVLMKPNDILYVPSNKVRSGMSRAVDSFIAIAIGRAIYSR